MSLKGSLNAVLEVPQLQSLVNAPSLFKKLIIAVELTPAQAAQRSLSVAQDWHGAAKGDNPNFAVGPFHSKVVKVTGDSLFDAVHATDELSLTSTTITLWHPFCCGTGEWGKKQL